MQVPPFEKRNTPLVDKKNDSVTKITPVVRARKEPDAQQIERRQLTDRRLRRIAVKQERRGSQRRKNQGSSNKTEAVSLTYSSHPEQEKHEHAPGQIFDGEV